MDVLAENAGKIGAGGKPAIQRNVRDGLPAAGQEQFGFFHPLPLKIFPEYFPQRGMWKDRRGRTQYFFPKQGFDQRCGWPLKTTTARCCTPDSYKAFVDLNPDPQHVGLGIAPYHLQNLKASVEDAIRTAGSQLLFFYAWQSADGLKQLPCHGPADFVPWLKALAEINYQGFVNPFMHGHPATEDLSAGMTKACAYLKDSHRRVMG